uniref:Uncharacterized protein n=1 Tax=Salix viminalis TaxID=40686 RepID=A0A6N2LUI8_SALVM
MLKFTHVCRKKVVLAVTQPSALGRCPSLDGKNQQQLASRRHLHGSHSGRRVRFQHAFESLLLQTTPSLTRRHDNPSHHYIIISISCNGNRIRII